MDKEIKLLILDDDIIDISLMKKGVLGCSYKTDIKATSSIQDAFDILNSDSIDCLVLDYCMPSMNAPAFLEKMRKLGIVKPKVIILTSMPESVISRTIESDQYAYSLNKSQMVDSGVIDQIFQQIF